jgi:hypothetical protein
VIASDCTTEGDAYSLSVERLPGREFLALAKQQTRKGIVVMKRLLLIALMACCLAFVPAQRSDAQVSVGIGGVGIGFGYPAYRYGYYSYPYGHGYYPYGYYRPYRYYGYGPSYYRYYNGYNGYRVYRHHRHHRYYHY